MNLTLTAKSRLKVASDRSEGMMKEADAEAAFATQMAMKRKYEEKMKKSDTLGKIMQDKKIIISGKNSEELYQFFEDTLKLVDEEEAKAQ